MTWEEQNKKRIAKRPFQRRKRGLQLMIDVSLLLLLLLSTPFFRLLSVVLLYPSHRKEAGGTENAKGRDAFIYASRQANSQERKKKEERVYYFFLSCD
jgi:hypothetical protein